MIALLLVFSLPAMRLKAQDDTIGFWKVQYMSKEIIPVNLDGEQQTYLVSGINDTSTLNIFYYTESPCRKCLCKMAFRDENGNTLNTIERKGYGDNRPFMINAKDLNYWLNKGKVYMYFSGKYDGWMPWIFMGALEKEPPLRGR